MEPDLPLIIQRNESLLLSLSSRAPQPSNSVGGSWLVVGSPPSPQQRYAPIAGLMSGASSAADCGRLHGTRELGYSVSWSDLALSPTSSYSSSLPAMCR